MKKNSRILEEEERFHDNWAKNINTDELCIFEAFEGPVSPEYRFAIQLLGNLKNKKILNPGCGVGEEAVYLAQKESKVWAVDISSGMLAVCRKLIEKFKLKGKIVTKKMNVEDLEFEDSSFDLIFGNSILHHVDIEKSAAEFYRVLKRNGKAVFIEPLFHNPFINYYRRIAKIVRTPHEHPLKDSDIALFSKYFSQVKHYEFQFFTLLIFVYFYLFQRVSPNKDRYWKKIIREGKKYTKIFNMLFSVDEIILKYFPFLRKFCWVTVIEAIK